MSILEFIFEGLLDSTMRKHDHIQAGEDRKLLDMNRQLNTLDQGAEDFEHRMEMIAMEYEKWVKAKAKKN